MSGPLLPGDDIFQKADFRVRVTNTSTSVTKVLTDILAVTVTHTKNDCMSWSVTLDNRDRKYSKYNPSSDFYGFTDPVPKYRWEISVKTKGALFLTGHPTPVYDETEEEEVWAYLSPTNRSFTNAATTGYEVTVTGTDYSYKLLKNNQSKITQRSTGLELVTMKSILGSILGDYSVAYDLDDVTDYTVPWLHFQGEIPLDMVRKLLAIRWAIYRFIGSTFTAWEPVYKVPPAEPDFYISDISSIEAISMSEDRQNIITSVVIRRTDEVGSIAFEAEGTETSVQSVDVNSSAFPDGAVALQYAESVINGTINEIWYFSDTGLGGQMGSSHGCPSPSAKSMTFYFQPTVGATEYSWHIIVRGRKPMFGENPALFENYCVKYRNTTFESYIGEECPASETVIEDLIPDVTTAQWYAEQYLKEVARKAETYQIVCGLHIKIYPGHTIAVKEWGMLLDPDSAEARFFVESVSHDLVSGTTNITASKYRPNDVITQVTPWPPLA